MTNELEKNAEQQGFIASGLFLFADFFNKEYGELANIINKKIMETPRDKMWTQQEIILLWLEAFNNRAISRCEVKAEKENKVH